ncbi:MAG: Maf family protein [Pseudomonadota bacterium]
MTLLLASASKARADMLRAAGVAVCIRPAWIDEAAVKSAMRAEAAAPRDLADTLAELKAARISGSAPGHLVLGADQILVQAGTIFDKPRDALEARKHLKALRGKSHHLISAAVIVIDGVPIWRHIGQAELTMRPFSDAFLDTYLESLGETALQTVGGYHLEGLGAQLFSRVQGDYFTILGLPLLQVLDFLRVRGVIGE